MKGTYIQGIVAFFDHAAPEGADANLNHSTIIQNLNRNIGELNGFLQMTHQ
jgi:hypothetical protein